VARGYCLYCNRIVDKLTIEHVLPADIGGVMKIGACGHDNRESARLVDTPLREFPDVAMLCAMHDVRNERRRGRRRKFELAGDLDDGSRAIYRPHAEDDLEQVTTSQPVVGPDGSFTYAFPASNHEVLRAATRKQLERDYPNKTITFDEPETRETQVVFNATRSIRACLWPRFTAKVALALADELFEPMWRSSYTAEQLRSIFLRGRSLEGERAHELPLNVTPHQLDADDRFFTMVRPWEHLLIAAADGQALSIRGALFGELGFEGKFACDQPAVRHQAWLFDARLFTVKRYDIQSLAAALTIRLAREGAATALHLERPRGKLAVSE
jgi:hypothetical protein